MVVDYRYSEDMSVGVSILVFFFLILGISVGMFIFFIMDYVVFVLLLVFFFVIGFYYVCCGWGWYIVGELLMVDCKMGCFLVVLFLLVIF